MDEKCTSETDKIERENEILELAKKELMRDIKCASMRAEQFGAHSWAKPQKYRPNKRFLRHMLVNTSRENSKKDDLLKRNRESKNSSLVSEQSQKYDHLLKRQFKHKRSRWDNNDSPKHRTSSSHVNDKEKRHTNKTKLKKNK